MTMKSNFIGKVQVWGGGREKCQDSGVQLITRAKTFHEEGLDVILNL